jgi:hypothetical protein
LHQFYFDDLISGKQSNPKAEYHRKSNTFAISYLTFHIFYILLLEKFLHRNHHSRLPHQYLNYRILDNQSSLASRSI